MTTSRLSYASSPESDLEMGPGPSSSLSLGNLPQLVKSNSDPSIATNQDNLERDLELNNLGDGMMPPPYTVSDNNTNFILTIFFYSSPKLSFICMNYLPLYNQVFFLN